MEALTLAADVTRVTVQIDATPEVNLAGSAGKYTWQNVNVTPGTYNFTFRAYKQVAGSGSFTLGGATLLAGENVTVALGAAVTTFTARESLQVPVAPFTDFNIGGAGAWGTATLTGVVGGDTLILNGVTFTAVTIPPVGNQFLVGLNDTETAINLTNAVNASTTLGAPHTAGIQYYITATQIGTSSVRFQAAAGPFGNGIAMAAPLHMTIDSFANHPTSIQSNVTAGNLAAVITTNVATKAYVVTTAAGNKVTVSAKTKGPLPAAIALTTSSVAGVTLGAFAAGVDQQVGVTSLPGTVITANLTTVLNVAILDTTTRDLLETGPLIGTLTFTATVPYLLPADVYATSGAWTFDASTTVAADAWNVTVTPTCPSGKGQTARLLAGPWAASTTWSVAGPGVALAAQTYYFRSSVLETCSIKIQVDKVRNIGPGNAAVVIGSDFRIFQTTVVPIVGQGGVIANVSYVQNPLLLSTVVNTKEGTCAVGALACDPTALYEGGVGPGECARIAPPAIAGSSTSTGRCSINKVGCVVTVPAAWAGVTAYILGDTVLNNGNRYVNVVAGTSAATGGPSGTGLAIVDGTATWDYVAPESGCLSLTYPDGKVHPQSCEAGTQNGRCNLDNTRCFMPPAQWATATLYAIGDRTMSCTAAGVCNIYVVAVGGTSGAAPGPSGTGAGIVDGTVTWNWFTPSTGCLDFVRPTGVAPAPWVTATPYLANATVTNGGNVYLCTTPGTSAAAPTGTGVGIVDGTVRWSFYSTYAAWLTTHGNAAAQTCMADSFEDVCVGESKDCGFTDPLNPNFAASVNSCSAGRQAGATQVQMAYLLGSPIANVSPLLNVVSCQNLDNTASMPATTALLSKTNSLAKFNVILPQNALVAPYPAYWCTFNARVVQTVQTTPPLTGGAGDLADEQQFQVYVIPQ